MFAKDIVRFEADVVAGVAALTPEIAAAGGRPDRGRLRAAAGRTPTSRRRSRDGRAAGPRGLGGVRRRRDDGPRRQHARPLDHRQGRRGRGDGDGRRRRQGPLRRRLLAGRRRSSRARSSRSGRATRSPSGRRRRCRSRPAPASPRVLEIPESHVRIVVPLLGGGFGSKCDFHFEGHVAALARASRRPVKLVFSRHEEFIAPDHRREGMVIELETGVKNDGTIVARRGKLVLDGGAYCGEGGFFAQMAAMHAIGPYKIAERRHRLVPGLHEQPAVELDPRPHGAAGLLGRRAAHGRGRRGDRHGSPSSCAAAR